MVSVVATDLGGRADATDSANKHFEEATDIALADMSPDRGADADAAAASASASSRQDVDASSHRQQQRQQQRRQQRQDAARILAERASAPQNFTARAVVLGLAIGTLVIFSNTYFGLQTGWIGGMSMPSALLSFAAFRGWDAVFPADRSRYKHPQALTSRLRHYLRLRHPFTAVENVLVMSVIGGAGAMPLGCGFVGVIVALEYLMDPAKDGRGPLTIGLGHLVIWAVGISFFGAVFGVPLRKQVVLREKLKFPTGTATALMIGLLHEKGSGKTSLVRQDEPNPTAYEYHDDSQDEEDDIDTPLARSATAERADPLPEDDEIESDVNKDWQSKIRLIGIAFALSSVYTIVTYFVPQLHNIPIFGTSMAANWLWTLNPSPAYVGQGIIMGPSISLHMLLGAILGWGVLSPVAKARGWASGPVDDWSTGSKGWIVWISLAIMLADSLVSLGWLVLRPASYYLHHYTPVVWHHARQGHWRNIPAALNTAPRTSRTGYSPLRSSSPDGTRDGGRSDALTKQVTGGSGYDQDDQAEVDAPPEHLVQARELSLWLVFSLVAYFASIHVAFPTLLPFGLDIMALLLAGLLSVMGVRALGSTDLNPVSGISKLTQLIFALVVPAANPQAITINLLAGAISESGAIQAGDMVSDLKVGHLLGASPKAQFYGQLIGGAFGAAVSALVYRLYTSVYTIPGGQFQVPTAYVWLFTAELVSGKGLPPRAADFALVFAAIFAVLTAVRIFLQSASARAYGGRLLPFVPGGIAVAVGMYNTPNFTLARAIGGVINGVWVHWLGRSQPSVVVMASGLILGEGLFSIVNILFAQLQLPHA